jgi:Phage portal protein, SPP1 Gp6-like
VSVMPQMPPRLAERTPEDWRDLLLDELDERAAESALYEDYYDGRHPLQFATSKYREAFGALFGAFADNWCQIVVDAPVERLKVIGFRVNGGVDEDAWSIWQQNALDVESVIAHTEAGKCGRCFLLVDPNEGEPRITVEHPAQMIVAHDPGDRRKRLAAVKRWLGDDGFQYLTLYLPDTVFKFESSKPLGAIEQAYDKAGIAPIEWVARTDVAFEADNPLGVVPVIPLENKPGLLGLAHSDLEPAVPLQNAVNKLCSDLIVTSEYGAFPQRVLTGVEVPKDPETGQPLAATELKAAMSRLWTFKPADAKVWDLAPADLGNFVKAVEMFIQHLAAQTRTPPHYLLGQVVNASGDALSVAEAGLVSKCRTKTLFFSDSWEEAIALALTAAGTDVAQADCEAIWANPERIAQGQLVDAAVKKKTLGIPLPVIWLELGYTPEQVAEMEAVEQSAAEAQLEAAATPAAPPPVNPPQSGPQPAPADQLPPGGTDG